MRISNLKLQNFRSHRDTSFEFSRVNIIRGRNGAGKSSIAMAIEQLLTGKCDLTDQAGRGAHALIASGTTELFVEAILAQPPHTLLPMNYRRSVTSGQLIIGPHAGQSAFQWLEANVAPIDVLSSVLNAHRFLQMNAKEQKALLAGALAPEPVPVDKEIRDLHASIAAGFPMQETVVNAEHVDKLHKWHFDQRTNINREIKAIGELNPPDEPQEKHSLAEVRTMIDELRKERDVKVRERERQLADFKGRADRLAAAIAQKAQHEPELLSSEQLEQCRKDAKNLKKYQQLHKFVEDLDQQLRMKRKDLAVLQNNGPMGGPKGESICSSCGQKLPEEQTSEQLDRIGLLMKEVDEQEEELAKSQAELRKMPDPALAQDKIDRHQRSMKPFNAAEIAIKEIGELGTAPDVSQLDEEIAAIDHRIECGNKVADEVSKYEGALALYQRNLVALTRRKEISAAFDRLVEYFGDGKLKAKLIDGKLPEFRDRINQVLYRFGFECEFEMDPYVLSVIQLDENGGMLTKPLNLGQLSESEQYRFSIAFSIALAETTGVKLVVIDRTDMLSPDARSELAAVLLESSLDQAFVLCTGEPAPTPEIPDVKFFELVNDAGSTRIEYVEEEAHANQ